MNNFSIFHNVLTSSERKRMKYVGIKKTLNPRVHFTNLERKYYSMLDELGIFYVAQYQITNRFFDAFLPEQNLLLEFDGSFWHKEKEEDCQYDFQRKNMQVDKLKNDMAKKNGMRIIRIKENKPVTQDQLKELIYS